LNKFVTGTEYLIREKKHQLDEHLYRGNHRIAFTLYIQDRKQFFNKKSNFDIFETELLKSLQKHQCDAVVYLFMPDHFHVLLQGKNKDSDMKKTILSFKQTTGYWFSKNASDFTWQKDFYDHVLRKDEDLNKQIGYILLNPVRKGLVDKWNSYPLKGSTVFDLDSWAKDRSDF
jgi:putative transposase